VDPVEANAEFRIIPNSAPYIVTLTEPVDTLFSLLIREIMLSSCESVDVKQPSQFEAVMETNILPPHPTEAVPVSAVSDIQDVNSDGEYFSLKATLLVHIPIEWPVTVRIGFELMA
jgi:hypothetical protein